MGRQSPSVAGLKGGNVKTGVATNLAVWWAALGHAVQTSAVGFSESLARTMPEL